MEIIKKKYSGRSDKGIYDNLSNELICCLNKIKKEECIKIELNNYNTSFIKLLARIQFFCKKLKLDSSSFKRVKDTENNILYIYKIK
jgi:hypothetical protein